MKRGKGIDSAKWRKAIEKARRKEYIPYASNDLTVKKAISTLVRLHGKVKETTRIVDKVLGVIDLLDLAKLGIGVTAKRKWVRRVRKVKQ